MRFSNLLFCASKAESPHPTTSHTQERVYGNAMASLHTAAAEGNKNIMITAAWVLVASASAALQLGPVRDSALALGDKRILLTSPRTEAAPLASALLKAGGRPMWAPAVRIEPLTDPSSLDDMLMRLAEYDVLVALCPHSIDSMAARWLSLSDGSTEVMQAMLMASKLEIAAIGTDALRFRREIGVPATVAPIEHSTRALAETLRGLGHLGSGARLLVATGKIAPSGDGTSSPVSDPPAAVASFLHAVDGADRMDTHRIVPTSRADLATEVDALASGAVDAVCVGSADELRSLLAACECNDDGAGGDTCSSWPTTSPPTLLTLGEETAAAARELLPADVELIELGARVSNEAVVAALEDHFGAGRLLF
jgi:uroporphyrinogen-III synthase